MGAEQQQEVKNLPRNRKCGNCRFFEPAPLWRKGWCRNPQLYPPHANHLVDSATIDCEGGFRSRIYWEPIPQAPVVQPTAATPTPKQPAVNRTRNTNPADQRTQPMSNQAPAAGQARSGAFGPKFDASAASNEQTRPQPQVRSYRPQSFDPPTPPPNVEPNEGYYDEPELDSNEVNYQEVEPAQQEVGAYRRPTRPATGGATPRPNRQTRTNRDEPAQERENLNEGFQRNLPSMQNLNLENFKLQTILPWLIVGVIALVILLVFIPSNNKHTGVTQASDANGTPLAANATADSSIGADTPTLLASTPRANTSPGSSNVKTPANGSSTTKAGAAAPANTPAASGNAIAGKSGTVNSADGINVRKDPSATGTVIIKLKKGDKVTLLDGPKTADGRDWYQIKTGEVTGWVAKEFIDVAA